MDRPVTTTPAPADGAARAVSGMTTRLLLAYVEREAGRDGVERLLDAAGLAGREAELRDEGSWFGPRERAALWYAAAEVLRDERVAEHVGAAILQLGAGDALKRALRALGTPELVLRNVVRSNHRFSEAFRLEALTADASRARVRLTDVSGIGHDQFECDYVRGLLRATPQLFDLPPAYVEHPLCGVRGDGCCEFEVVWSAELHHLRHLAAVVGAGCVVVGVAGALALPVLMPVAAVLAAGGASAIGWRTVRLLGERVRTLQARVVEQDLANERIFVSLGDLSTDLRRDEVLDKIGERAGVAIAQARFVLLLEADGALRAHGDPGLPAASLGALEAWASAHRETLEHGPVIVDEAARIAALAPLAADPALPLRSLCAAPLRSGDRLLGALVALSGNADVFLPHEAAALGAYAAQAAIAMSNAHLVERLERQAAEDPLTGLANQRAFHRACVGAFAGAERSGAPVAIVALDLDHFKSINDVHGHLYGDEVLRATARALRGVVRPGDTVARMGGEEFALLLPGAGTEAATEVADRARAAVAREVVLPDRGLTCSAGVVSHPDCGERRDRLVALADRALHEAKERGRNRTVRHVADPGARPAVARAEIAGLLEGEDGLEIHFQPIVMLATGRVIAHEALSRFPGLPGRAIPEVFHQAHREGLGAQLEAEAVRRALTAPGRPPASMISVNLSVSSLCSPELWAVLPDDLAAVVVEITEDELFGPDAELGRALARLRERGARIALDDAGAGYSGLQQIVRVRPDIVKLDRSLVDGVADDPARAALVASFASFATQTGGAVCAEGIERAEDLRAVADLDIAYGQGYLLGRPAPAFAPAECSAAAPVAATVRGGMRAFDPPPREQGMSLGGSVPERLATMIAAAANADRVDLWRLDRRAGALVAVRVPDREPGDHVGLGGRPALAHALASGEAGQVVRGDRATDRAERRELAALGYESALLVPLDEGGVILGLVACYRRTGRPWSREAVARVRSRAAPLASVLSTDGLTLAEPA